MATTNFETRIARINQAHKGLAPMRAKAPIRSLQSQPVAMTLQRRSSKRFAIFDHFQPMAIGSVLGCIAAVLLSGLTSENALWGPGTALNEMLFLPALGGLALAPILMIASLFLASRKPGFALFSLSYLTGLVVTMVI